MFGYLPDPESIKDWQWETLFGAAPDSLPKRVSHESQIGPAWDQGSTSECVCFSVAAMKRFQEWRQNGQWLDFDIGEFYDRCKAVDGAPSSAGTYPRVAMDLLRTEGLTARDGQRYSISSAARLCSVDEMRHALVEKGPVLFGLAIDDQMLSSLPAGELYRPENRHGGHAMLAVGYDDPLQAFRVRNSWGATWSDSGHLWIPYELFTVPGSFDAWSTVDA